MPRPLSFHARRELLQASAAASALAGLGLPVDVLVARGKGWSRRSGARSGAEPRPPSDARDEGASRPGTEERRAREPSDVEGDRGPR
ncbi:MULTISPECIES: hypothetical protein [Anaeromyxobacter]|uniref:hypothetical protein n=1 Tax=Anaeromyxobacter TaxID=161492 RepID=UPI001F5A9676|nr:MULTISPECIES: hypothetical protein [unclassified Anaeromyxobacter]